MKQKKSVKPTVEATTENKLKDSYVPYMNEILPDFQQRLQLTIKDVRALPEEDKAYCGMDTMKAQTLVGKYFVEYASNSSIHGFNHLVAPHRHPIEKFLAVLILLTALAGLITVSLISWDRYQTDAVVLIYDTNYKNYKVTKPSIYICPLNVIDESKFPQVFSRYNVEDTIEARNFFHFLSNVSYYNSGNTPDFYGAPPSKWLEILYNLKKDDINESEADWVVTEIGLCLVQDNLVSIYNSVEYWLANNWTIVPFPEHPKTADEEDEEGDTNANNILNVLPTYNFDEHDRGTEIITIDGDSEFYLHSPFDIIHIDVIPNTVFKTLEYQEADLKIVEVKTSTKLGKLSYHQKGCKFNWENNLKMSPVYSIGMCISECRFNQVKKHCGCYPHFARPMPNVPICNSEQLRCMEKNLKFLFLHGSTIPPECGCYPNCNNIKYFFENVVVTPLQIKFGSMLCTLTITIDYPKFLVRRIELFRFSDFLTSVGGATGLFLGGSVLSFAEILYYSTIRIYMYKRAQKRKHRK